jgi:hypothetical protein
VPAGSFIGSAHVREDFCSAPLRIAEQPRQQAASRLPYLSTRLLQQAKNCRNFLSLVVFTTSLDLPHLIAIGNRDRGFFLRDQKKPASAPATRRRRLGKQGAQQCKNLPMS